MKLVFEVHHYHHTVDETAILAILGRLEKRIEKMATDLTRITSEVTEMSDAVDAGVALLTDLAQRIRDNSTDPAALEELADKLDASGNKLAEAIVANTPDDGDE